MQDHKGLAGGLSQNTTVSKRLKRNLRRWERTRIL